MMGVPPAPPEAKASGFNSTVRSLRAMLPPSAFERVVRSLPAATTELVQRPPLPLEWIPVQRYADLIEAALREGFGGDEERIVDVGRRMIVGDLKTIYRMFIKLLSPQYVIQRSARLWLTYNRNNGFVRVKQTGPQSCEVHYESVRGIYAGHWAYQRGVILGVIEATGYRHVAVKVLKGGRSEHDMVLHTSWG